jgi:glycogen(starch) synthase
MDSIVFEVSHEVAHKVGGIYAVIASKAPQMRKRFKEYYAIGPYDPKSVAIDFEEVDEHPFHKLCHDLEMEGIKCVYGRWVRADRVNCILIDPIGLRKKLNDIKTDLWTEYGIDSLRCDALFDDSAVWSKAVGMVLERILKLDEFKNEQVICQFHEWLTGAGLLHLKSAKAKAGLVFTTHATTLGRTMAERGEDLVKKVDEGIKLKRVVKDEHAKAYGIEAIHTLEKACAQNADVFTTVSKVTADEAEYVLGRYPDALTLNGLAIDNYPSMEELSISHKEFRQRIKHFVMSFFSPYYKIDTKNCLYFFTSGRYEYHNKGFDILLDALGVLNQRLKEENSKKTAVVFLWIPAQTKGGNLEVLDNLAVFDSIEDEVLENLDEIREHILESVSMGKLPTKTDIFDKPFLYNLKQMMARMRSKAGKAPPICALELSDQNDLILKVLKEKGLDNSEDDRVKIVYYPTYLSSADGLLNLNYNDAITGCHLGIFPSYYEPWGYTPLETAAMAVPSVTTNQAGFGRFIEDFVKEDKSAIVVLDRKKGDKKTVEQLAEHLHFILNTTRKERVQKKIEAKRLSEVADWGNLITNYISAYGMALERIKKRK